MEWLFAIADSVVMGGLSWWRWRAGAGRQRRLMLLCRRAGLEFAPLDPFPKTAWLPFPMFGHERHRTENVVWDPAEGDEIRAFDYWYADPADDRPISERRRLTCAVVPLGFAASHLRVAPRDAIDVSGAFRHPEVRLELEEFDHRFRVEAEDAGFAVAFLDQRMMEAFLGLPHAVAVDANDDALLLWAPRLPAEQVLVVLDVALTIRRRIPRVLASLFPPRPAEGPRERRWLQGRWSPEPIGTDPSGPTPSAG